MWWSSASEHGVSSERSVLGDFGARCSATIAAGCSVALLQGAWRLRCKVLGGFDAKCSATSTQGARRRRRRVLGGAMSGSVGARAFHASVAIGWLALSMPSAGIAAQTPAPVERMTFDEAIRRAVEKNPSAAIAAAGILRAEALLSGARSASRVQVNGNVTTTTLNSGVEFQGATVTPRNQLNASLDLRL